MNQIATQTMQVYRGDLEKMKPQFEFALPKHITVEKFVRVIITALQNNPSLMKCSRQSFFNAAMRAAQDGLYPDGREGVIVPYGANDTAQWIPMIHGIRKLVRNSGEIVDWNVQVVQEGDQFDFRLGDEPYIHHKPSSTGGRTRKVLWAYSIAKLKDGSVSREVMNAEQIEDVRKRASRASKGPWADPVYYPEMARKTVARLHSKQLPMSTDLDRILRRDDEMYDVEPVERKNAPPATSVSAALDYFADDEARPVTSPANAESAGSSVSARNADITGPSAASTAAARAPSAEDPEIAKAVERGKADKARGFSNVDLPMEYRSKEATALAAAWLRGLNSK